MTTLNNVGSETFFNAVFINPEQVNNFLSCIDMSTTHCTSYIGYTEHRILNNHMVLHDEDALCLIVSKNIFEI